ncbi:MAG TPA: winged helix-turn-helix domain-containing protein [Woeseiaceae bacterium]|nr:winged helix-turn-helix domain-containing protein [Woeseiaceae bacterium]
MTDSSHRPSKLEFADFTLDLNRGALLSAGSEIRLRSKSFEVLRYLVEHQGHLVSQQTLLDEIWGDVVVTEDSVRQCIIDIRRALGDTGQRIVRTVPRRGYLFDVAVHAAHDPGTAGDDAPDAHRAAAWKTGAGLALALLAAGAMWRVMHPGSELPEPAEAPPPNSIAVMRFDDMSRAGDQAYLCEGIAEEIIHRLTQSPSLRVIARTSSFAVSGDSIPEIAEQLKVAYVLEGSLRKSGNAIRVTAQLVDATTNAHQWSVSYDRSLDDILLVEAEIAEQVAQTLDVTLAAGSTHDATDARAHERYLQGHFFYLRRVAGDLEKAEDYYRQALDVDPEFARAWVGLAAIANLRLNDEAYYVEDAGQRGALREAQAHAVEQALKFGPELPEAHMRASAYYWQIGERAASLQHLDTAEKLDPDNWLVLGLKTTRFLLTGQLSEAVETMQESARLDPLNPTAGKIFAELLAYAGRLDDARAQFVRVFELFPTLNSNDSAVLSYAQTLMLLREFDEALELLRSAPAGNRRLQGLALVYHGLGREADANQALAELTGRVRDGTDLLAVAEVYAYRGDAGQALAWLRRLTPALNCLQPPDMPNVYYSPFLALLAGNADWEKWRTAVARQMADCAW